MKKLFAVASSLFALATVSAYAANETGNPVGAPAAADVPATTPPAAVDATPAMTVAPPVKEDGKTKEMPGVKSRTSAPTIPSSDADKQ